VRTCLSLCAPPSRLSLPELRVSHPWRIFGFSKQALGFGKNRPGILWAPPPRRLGTRTRYSLPLSKVFLQQNAAIRRTRAPRCPGELRSQLLQFDVLISYAVAKSVCDTCRRSQRFYAPIIGICSPQCRRKYSSSQRTLPGDCRNVLLRWSLILLVHGNS
jgi:hypothetical protein